MRQLVRSRLTNNWVSANRHMITPPDLLSVWNAINSIIKHLNNTHFITYKQLYGSRTPITNLCATVSARTLSEN